MRRRIAIAFAAVLLTPSAVAGSQPPTPASIYQDFVQHGRLTLVYPPSLLRSIIDDASLNQYGDPLVMLRLRRAARLQLAGVMPTQTTPVTTGVATTTQATTNRGGTSTGAKTRPGPTTTGMRTTKPPARPTRRRHPFNAAVAPLLSTRAIVLIILAFVLAVGALGISSARARRR